MARGTTPAGFPAPAEEELLDVINWEEFLTPRKEASYILKVKSDSMQEAGIFSGDMVIVERRAQYKLGEIVVVLIDGEYTMKYFSPKETLAIIAVVTALVRKY